MVLSVGSDRDRLDSVGLTNGRILTVVCCLSWVLSPNRSLCSDVAWPTTVVPREAVVVVLKSWVVAVVSVTFF